jgi:CRISPR-associated exonuclease Cas4
VWPLGLATSSYRLLVIEMTWLVLVIVLLLVVAFSAYALSKSMASRTGLPGGELLYSDTGFAVGKLGSVSRDELGQKQEKPLVSQRFGLIGRPDYLVRTSEGIVPVEIKSAKYPFSGRPHDSHAMQLAAYCLLVEEVLGANAPYGIIQYRDCEVSVDYTPELRAELLDILDEMREARRSSEVHRSHDDSRRCANCYMQDYCDEAL